MTNATRDETGPLTASGLLKSDLWIDRRSAGLRLSFARLMGRVDRQKATLLKSIIDRGYAVLPISLSETACQQIESDVDRLWKERSESVAFAYHSLLTPFSESDESAHRKPSCRIADLHTYSEAARDLFLSRELFAMIEAMFGVPAVATQSLYFEWGSQQGLHRDPVYVNMPEPSHLAAAWVALEDIGPECGPLVYVPGSHRLPYYQYEPGRYLFDHARDGDEELQASQQWDEQQCKAAGLGLESLTCRRGDVLIWHHSLLHGGSFPTNPALTRKSFVVHYTSLATMPVVRNSYVLPDHDDPVVLESDRLLESNGCRGFDSPLNVSKTG